MTYNLTKEVAMKKNEGSIDRVIRIVAGLGILSLVFIGPQTYWGYLGVVPLFTGLFGFCPLYKVLGMRTCPLAKESK